MITYSGYTPLELTITCEVNSNTLTINPGKLVTTGQSKVVLPTNVDDMKVLAGAGFLPFNHSQLGTCFRKWLNPNNKAHTSQIFTLNTKQVFTIDNSTLRFILISFDGNTLEVIKQSLHEGQWVPSIPKNAIKFEPNITSYELCSLVNNIFDVWTVLPGFPDNTHPSEFSTQTGLV